MQYAAQISTLSVHAFLTRRQGTLCATLFATATSKYMDVQMDVRVAMYLLKRHIQQIKAHMVEITDLEFAVLFSFSMDYMAVSPSP